MGTGDIVVAGAAGFVGGFTFLYATDFTLLNAAWCIAGEQHCAREWIGALSGWAAAVATVATVFMLLRQVWAQERTIAHTQQQVEIERERHQLAIDIALLPTKQKLVAALDTVYRPLHDLSHIGTSRRTERGDNEKGHLFDLRCDFAAIMAAEIAASHPDMRYLLSIDDDRLAWNLQTLVTQLVWFEKKFLVLPEKAKVDIRTEQIDGYRIDLTFITQYGDRAKAIEETAEAVVQSLNGLYTRYRITPRDHLPIGMPVKTRFQLAERVSS